VQGPDRGHHHHSPRLRLLLAAGAAGLALAGPAAAAQGAPLPSPLTPLSPAPPLGAATSSAESVQHRIRSVVQVHVSVLPNGVPFAVAADQTLLVTVKGDYYLTIGAPLLDVEALPGSESTPGLRSTSIVWEGFNPLRRTLKARAKLTVARAAPALPLRIEVGKGSTTFVNTTGVIVAAYTADADPAPLVSYLRRLRGALSSGRPLPEGTATLRGTARATQAHVAVPLLVDGSVGGRRIHALVTGRLTVPVRGKISVSVEPRLPAAGSLTGLSGREALARATRFILTVARLRQFERFLADPDPTGASTTVYLYRSATPRRGPAAVQPAAGGRDWTTTIAVAAGLLLAAAAGLAVWARA
jgi:hypothetical protein